MKQEDAPKESSPSSETQIYKTEDTNATAPTTSGSYANPQEPIFFKKPSKKLKPSDFFVTTNNRPETSEEEVNSGENLNDVSSHSFPPPPLAVQPPRAEGRSQDIIREQSSKLYLSSGSQGNPQAFSDPTGRSTIMSEVAEDLRRGRQGKKKTTLFDKGGAAATALAAVASILGSAVLAALLTPSEVIFTHKDQGLYQYNYCYVSDFEYRDEFCGAMRALYSFSLIITLIFDILCLMSTIIVAIGMSSWLTLAYSFFILSIIFLGNVFKK